MRRALITSAGLAGLAVAAAPVLAAPAPVDQGRTAGVRVMTTLPGGDTLQLEIKAAQLSGGPRMVVDTERCGQEGSCVTRVYAGDLPDHALVISASDPQATLSTTLDGRPLAISWRPAANGGYTVGSGTAEGDGPDTFASEYTGTSADTTVSYDGRGCHGIGGVGSGVVVDTAAVSGGSTTEPLSALHLPDGTAFAC
jgi:hypothetical protein